MSIPTSHVVLRAPILKMADHGILDRAVIDLNQNGTQDVFADRNGFEYFEPEIDADFAEMVGATPGRVTAEDVGCVDVEVSAAVTDAEMIFNGAASFETRDLDWLTEQLSPGARWALETDPKGQVWYVIAR